MPAYVPVLEVRKRRLRLDEIERNRSRRSCGTPDAIAAIALPLLAPEVTEVLGVFALTTRNTLLGWIEVGRGTLDGVTSQPCDIIRPLLLAGAACFVLVHNHPSGDPSPSHDDRLMTLRMQDAAALMGLRLLDHVIVAPDTGRFFSLLQHGMMQVQADV